MPNGLDISVVIPCLDEEAAVEAVVDQGLEGIERSGRSGEVIVVDNGSSDRSAELAAKHGARVSRSRDEAPEARASPVSTPPGARTSSWGTPTTWRS
jgi:glycosyltransferase involved in cell wall biosynthesis